MDSGSINGNYVIQSLLQKADALTNSQFPSNSAFTVIGQDQYATTSFVDVGNTSVIDSSDSNGVKIEEVDAATANQIVQSLSSSSKVYPQYQIIESNNANNFVIEEPSASAASAANFSGELYRDPNGPQIIRRPPAQGPLTYQQNISVRFLQPPPVPPPGPLVIKEVRPPQLPPPPPLVIRQRAPPLPTPSPLVLRERPPHPPAPIPTQTVIKKLPAAPVPPRSIVVERYPATPARPRDIIIERWVPYSKEPQKRKVITHRAPPPRAYPQPRNTIIAYEAPQVNVVRSVRRLGVQAQNPQEYVSRYGHTLLDASTLVAQAQQIGVNEDLGPPSASFIQQYQTDNNIQYYLSGSQTGWEPEYEYTTVPETTIVETQTANNNQQGEIYWVDPQEDVNVILQRLGLSLE
ncbi:unnamed protein product [Adineta steineri]|uniref:Uncharacterized protein n=1 Tax=Adineta steineri TaxID=433720 RepID=A0A813QK87_9BILA|nr:unnamed protein product [Adineta steineri]CAF0768929.1 unnamed protein product [Adineta steineri]